MVVCGQVERAVRLGLVRRSAGEVRAAENERMTGREEADSQDQPLGSTWLEFQAVPAAHEASGVGGEPEETP